MPRRRGNAEQVIQRALVQHLRLRAWPDVVWFAVPNGGWRSPVEGAILKATGVLPGVPDLVFIHRERAYFLELKTEEGKPTEKQLEVISRLEKAGAYTAICYGLDRALACLTAWGLIREAKVQ